MQGFQLTFFTQQDRLHGHLPLCDWLIEEARKLGIGGATVIAASAGLGRERRLHSARFFDLADQPVLVIMALSAEDMERLFARLSEEQISIFHTRAPVEFGMT